MNYSVIIVAAGKGTRTGLTYNKVFYKIGNAPIITQTLKPFLEDADCAKIIMSISPHEQEEFEKIYALNKELGLPVRIADIGITEEQFFETMDRIPQMSDIRHYPYAVTKEMLMQAYETIEQLSV